MALSVNLFTMKIEAQDKGDLWSQANVPSTTTAGIEQRSSKQLPPDQLPFLGKCPPNFKQLPPEIVYPFLKLDFTERDRFFAYCGPYFSFNDQIQL